MDWQQEVKAKMNRGNQILFSKKSDYLQDLITLIDEQNHKTMVLWAFEFAEETVKRLEEKYPNETRPQKALEVTKLWASGQVKMPVAKREILNCHAFAKEINLRENIALCHAVGQACGVVHANGHAMGFPLYDLTAIVYKFGIEDCREYVENRKQEYYRKNNLLEESLQRLYGRMGGFYAK